jgi:hypothetical protein
MLRIKDLIVITVVLFLLGVLFSLPTFVDRMVTAAVKQLLGG